MPAPSSECLLQLLQRFLNHRSQVHQIQSLLTTQGHLLHNPNSQFHSKWKPTLFYNTLIRAHLTNSPHSSLYLFTLMLSHQTPPNSHTFPPLLKASSSLSLPSFALSLHTHLLKRGVLSDPFAQTSLLACYSNVCGIVNARKVFDEIPWRGVVEFNAMIDAYAKNGDIGSACLVFKSMCRRDVVSWTSLVNGFLLSGCFNEAICCFRAMMGHEDVRCGFVRPNEAAYVSVLSSCANLNRAGALRLGKQVHGHMIRSGISLTGFMGTSLIDFYGKVGCLDYLVRVFDQMSVREVCAWNALVHSLTNNGREMQALDVFEKMKEESVCPSEVTFVAVLTACARAKLVEVGLELFHSMWSKFGVVPIMEHYGCVVNLLGRAGLLVEAGRFVESMPFEADVSVLGALLGACKVHGAIMLGNEVGKRIVELQPQHCGQYVTLATICAGLERWDLAAELRKEMVQAGVRKVPACSLIGSG